MVIGSNWIHLRSSRDARRRFIGAYFVAIRDTSLIFYEFFLNEMCFFTIMIIWFLFVEMFKYTLKCGSLQNKIWYYSALVPKYLPSEASIPGPSLVIVVAICCRSSVPSTCWDPLSKKIFADNPPNFSFQFQQRSQGVEAIVGTSYKEEGVRCCLNWRTLTWRGDFARGGAKADNLFWNWKEESLYLWSAEAAGWELSLEVAKWGQNDSNVPRPGLSSRGLK